MTCTPQSDLPIRFGLRVTVYEYLVRRVAVLVGVALSTCVGFFLLIAIYREWWTFLIVAVGASLTWCIWYLINRKPVRWAGRGPDEDSDAAIGQIRMALMANQIDQAATEVDTAIGRDPFGEAGIDGIIDALGESDDGVDIHVLKNLIRGLGDTSENIARTSLSRASDATMAAMFAEWSGLVERACATEHEAERVVKSAIVATIEPLERVVRRPASCSPDILKVLMQRLARLRESLGSLRHAVAVREGVSQDGPFVSNRDGSGDCLRDDQVHSA